MSGVVGSSGGIVEAIKRVAANEVKKVHTMELGIVTSVFPRSTNSDKDNYECNITLKDKNVELRKVPVATQHIGLSNIPHVGDLVLVTFIGGDINFPVIIGRLYNDKDRPPISKEEEIIYKPPYSKNTKLQRLNVSLPEGIVTVTLHDDRISTIAGKSSISANAVGEMVFRSTINQNSEEACEVSLDNTKVNVSAKVSGKLCRITLDNKGLTIDTNAEININSTGKMNVTSKEGDLTLTAQNIILNAKQKMALKSAQQMSVESSGAEVTIKSNKIMSLASDDSLDITSQRSMKVTSAIESTVESSGIMTIRGKMVNINP